MILFRHVAPAFPFLWETPDQPSGRWHGDGEGPVHYLADTPEGAWAEFLRHEGITQPDELAGIQRAIWAIDVADDLVAAAAEPALPEADLLGGVATYASCQAEAHNVRAGGINILRAPSAALLPGGAHGWNVHGGLQPGPARDGQVIVLFGPRPDLLAWSVVEEGRPGPNLLPRVRPLIL